MGKSSLILGITFLAMSYSCFQIFKDEVPPEQLPDFYWRPTDRKDVKEDTSIQPFSIQIAHEVLTDLKNRLKLETGNTSRLAPPLEGIAFQYGFNTKVLPQITEYWLNTYDWRSREKLLNTYPHFKTKIDGLSIHFQHIKSQASKKYKTTVPLLLLHGWPGSFADFQKMIPLLIDPRDSDLNFELVIASLPGYGFSEASYIPGLAQTGMAQINFKLMKRLGYDKFYIQAGDWGALVTSNMASFYPDNVKGIHLSMCDSPHPRSLVKLLISSIRPTWFMDQDQADRLFPLKELFRKFIYEFGYFHLQATKPDTLGVGIANSTSGLAAYILEKWAVATNYTWLLESNGGLLTYYSIDDLIDLLMIYWVSNSFPTSIRLYAEAFSDYEMSLKMHKVPVLVPTGCIQAPYEFFALQNEWMIRDRFPNLVSFTKLARGGHYPAFEIPDLLAQDVLQFVTRLEIPKAAKYASY